MNILTMYRKVSLRLPLEQQRFFDYFNETAEELAATYNSFGMSVFVNDEFIPIGSLDDENPIKPLFCNAVIDNIIFLSGGDSAYKAEFARKAGEAWNKYWGDKAKHRHVKRVSW